MKVVGFFLVLFVVVVVLFSVCLFAFVLVWFGCFVSHQNIYWLPRLTETIKTLPLDFIL